MSQSSHQQEILSQTEDIIISEDFPAIEAEAESSGFNRLGKMIQKVGQNEWISELDLFSIPMKLNINGKQTLQTQFGGLMYLLTVIVCIFLTVIYQYPDGIKLSKPITFYTVNQPLDNTPYLFEHTDTLLTIYLYNQLQQRTASQTEIDFFLKKMSVLSVTAGKATMLQVSTTGCGKGAGCLKKSAVNELIVLSGQLSSSSQTTLNVQIVACGLFQVDPILGACADIYFNYAYVIQISSFKPVSGDIQSYSTHVILSSSIAQTLKFDTASFTTNNDFFGHLANIMPVDIQFYQPSSQVQPDSNPYYDTSLNCLSPTNMFGGFCTQVSMVWSGSTNVYTENFDDITAPIVFFLSLLQTSFYLIYIIIIRNYANNALFLRIADSVVFIEDGAGRHYNFKSGPSVFFACLIHNNKITQAIDYLLYRFCETHIKRFLSLKAQLTIKMIDYGERCLGEEMVFEQMNRACEQENLQPTKIIFDEENQEQSELTQKEKSLQEAEAQNDDGRPYFQSQIEQQAFKRMCKDHDYYSATRKKHLSVLLKSKEKTYKLVLHAQSLFERYRLQVRAENGSKQVQLPIGFAVQDQSAVYLRKSNA